MQTEFDLKGLQAFLAVVEHRTVRKAAQVLDVTPSAVSQSIVGLERSLGVELFNRDTRPLRLTPAGRRMLQSGEHLMGEVCRLKARVCAETLSMQELRLGLGESVTTTMSPWLLARLYKKVANLVVYSGLAQSMSEKLRNGSLDVVICSGAQLEDEKWLWQAAYEEEFLLVCSRTLPSVSSVEDLRHVAQTHPYICYNQESSDQIQANRILNSSGIFSTERIAVSSSYAIVGLVAQAGGFALLPPSDVWCGRQFLSDVRFCRLPVSLRETRKMWVVGEANRGIEAIELVRSLAVEVMREQMLEEFRNAAPGLEQFVRL